MRRAWAILAVSTGIGCSAIIGTRDLSYDPDASDQGAEAGADVQGSTEAGTDAPIQNCGADLANDAKNCGRCGRDCLGAKCTAGACESIELASGLDTPTGISVDDENVYLTLTNSNVVVKASKTVAGAVTTIATGQTLAFGVEVNGPTLFWSNRDFSYDSDPANKGGVMKCTIASCQSTITRVASGEWAQNLHLSNGYLYFAENNASRVKWLKTDGSDVHTASTAGVQPYGIAGDGQFVYYNTTSIELNRVPITGGASTDFASYGVGYQARGDIEVDGDYVYYAFTDADGNGQVIGAPKDTQNVTRRTFGPSPAPFRPLAMAFDDTYIYWSLGAIDPDSSDPTGAGGELRACHKTGCIDGEPIVLIKDIVSAGELAVDQTAVYMAVTGTFSAPSGALRKVAKP